MVFYYSFCKGLGCREGSLGGEDVGAYMVVVGVVIGRVVGGSACAVLTALVTAGVSGWRGIGSGAGERGEAPKIHLRAGRFEQVQDTRGVVNSTHLMEAMEAMSG